MLSELAARLEVRVPDIRAISDIRGFPEEF